MTDKKKENKLEKTINSTPKNLTIPFLLLSLRGHYCLHGYKLIQQLTKFGFHTIDQGNIYRTLRQLEKDNLVTSWWDTSSKGPARRLYSITEAGEKYLDLWARSLEQYQSMIESFFHMYSNLFMPSTKKNQEDEN